MSNTDKLKKQAKLLANITFKLQKICQEKEAFFASRFDLTSMEFRCLKYIKDKSNLSVSDLASNMNLTPSRITYIITSLEKKNFIEREMDKNDRRNIRIKLKNETENFVNEIDEQHALLHEDIFGKLDSEDRDSILNSLDKMYDSLKEWSEKNLKKNFD